MQLFRNILHSGCDRKLRLAEELKEQARSMYATSMTQLATAVEEQKAIVDYTLLEKEQLELKLKASEQKLKDSEQDAKALRKQIKSLKAKVKKVRKPNSTAVISLQHQPNIENIEQCEA